MRPALAFVAGLLVTFSLPPWGWWPLAFVGIALFAFSLTTPDGEPASRRARFQRGWLFGLGWLAPGMAWMWFLTAPGYVVAFLLFAVLHGVAAAVAPSGPWRVIGQPLAHTVAEALRMSFPFGGVPLATLGISQAASPLVALARVGGVLLITWATLQIGFSLAEAIAPGLARTSRSGGTAGTIDTAGTGARRGAVAVAVVLALVIVAGTVAPRGAGTGTTIRVAAVQGGGPQGTLAINTDPRDVIDRHLAATRSISPDDGIDLVVWPENVIDVDDIPFSASAEMGEVAAEAERLGAPFAVGITEDVAPGRFTNAQVIVTPDGELTSRYDKVRRVPFGEYFPMRGLLQALGAPVERVPNDAVAGTGPAVLDTELGTLAVVISWEVFFGGRAREGVNAGGGLLLNPTNGSSYTLTILQSQQVASSRLRAIETGRWVVQVSPTGFSAFITPTGEVLDRTGISERAVIVRDVEMRHGLTWYARIGDVPLALVAALGLATTAWFDRGLRLRRPRSHGRPDPVVPTASS